MRLFDLFRRREHRSDPLENPSVSLSSPGIWAWLVGGNNPTASGELINHYTALQQGTVYACITLLAESVASLPLRIYERSNQGRIEATDHPLFYLLAIEPNPEMTAFTFLETLTGCLALTGNGYAEIVENRAGDIGALFPLHPLKTEPYRIADGRPYDVPDNSIIYKTSDGMPSGQTRMITADRMIHVRLFSLDGLKGLSPIEQARQGVGLARAAEKYGARFFGNDSRPGGVMVYKGKLDEKQQHNVRDSWERAQGGENQGKTAFISGDWDYKQIGIAPEQAQFLETRQFQRAEIASWWRIPPHMVGDTTRLSNNNAEQQSLSFVTDTLRPYLSRIEGEIIRKCMPTIGRNANKHFVQFDVSERLRGDFKTTMDGYAVGKQWGFYSTNDVRYKLGENPIGPAGDVYWAPVNMQNADRLVDSSEAPRLPAPADTDDDNSRGALENVALAFGRMLRDAAGRFCHRKERDFDAILRAFEPVLTGIGEFTARDLSSRFELVGDWAPAAVARQVRDAAKVLEKRAAAWSIDQVDQVVADDLRRAVRAIVVNLYREAGGALALKGELHA